MNNCFICAIFREQLVNIDELTEQINIQLDYYQERIDSLIFANINRNALFPYYQALDILQQILQLYSTLYESIDQLYESHLYNH